MDNTLRDAIYDNNVKLVEELIDEGAEVNQARTNGRTPLWIAAARGQLAVAQLLLDRGSDVNKAETTFGRTPLWVAALFGQLDVVQLLLDRGAEVTKLT